MNTIKVVDITNRWDLAQTISDKNPIPEHVLKKYFEIAIKNIELQAGTQYAPEIKLKAWKVLSSEKINRLHEVFLLAFCDKILGDFTDPEIDEMLTDFNNGALKDCHLTSLKNKCAMQKGSITEAVYKETLRQNPSWCSELTAFLNHEHSLLNRRKELAELLSGSQNATEHILKLVFDETLVELQKEKRFPLGVVVQIWRSFLQTKLPLLKKVYVQTFCDRILNVFSDKEIETMIKDYRTTGLEHNMKYTRRLTEAYVSNNVLLSNIEVVTNTALSQAREWKPEIAAAFRKAGLLG